MYEISSCNSPKNLGLVEAIFLLEKAERKGNQAFFKQYLGDILLWSLDLGLFIASPYHEKQI
jgi:hypothetical protein